MTNRDKSPQLLNLCNILCMWLDLLNFSGVMYNIFIFLLSIAALLPGKKIVQLWYLTQSMIGMFMIGLKYLHQELNGYLLCIHSVPSSPPCSRQSSTTTSLREFWLRSSLRLDLESSWSRDWIRLRYQDSTKQGADRQRFSHRQWASGKTHLGLAAQLQRILTGRIDNSDGRSVGTTLFCGSCSTIAYL